MNDRLKFRTPYYLPDPDGKDQFIGFEHWTAIGGRPKMMVSWGKDEQCTGWRDKNLKPIYEGDIVKAGFGTTPFIGTVVFNNDKGFGVISQESKNTHLFMPFLALNDIEIIGNIHEQKDAA